MTGVEIAGAAILGLVAGLLAASLGIGGGVVIVPALVVFFALGQHAAEGTSLAVILPTAVVGLVVHARARRVDWRIAVIVAAGGIIGGFTGSQIALALDGVVLRRMFAVLLVVLAVRMLLSTTRRKDVTRSERR